MFLDRAPAFVVRRPDDRRAETIDGAELGVGCGVHHHHAAPRAGLLGGERDALRGISGPPRPAPAGEWLRRKPTHRVIAAANLERADGLERFQLEKNLGNVRSGRAQRNQRRATRGAVYGARGLANGLNRDGTLHYRSLWPNSDGSRL